MFSTISTTQYTSSFDVVNDIALIFVFFLGFYLFSTRSKKVKEHKTPCWAQDLNVADEEEEEIIVIEESINVVSEVDTKALEIAAAKEAAEVEAAAKEAEAKLIAENKLIAEKEAAAKSLAIAKALAEKESLDQALAEESLAQAKVEAEHEVIEHLAMVRSPSDIMQLRQSFEFACDNGVDTWSGDVVEALLDAASRVRDQTLLKQIVQVARRVGIPSARAYGSLLRASDSLPAARAIWEELMCSGLVVSESEYVIMIAACAAHGAGDEAKAILTLAKESLGNVSIALYAPMLKAFCARKEISEALTLFEELRTMLSRRSIPLPLSIFNLMIEGCSRVGRMEEAQEIFDAAADLNIETDVNSYASLVKGYCVTAQLENALTLFAQLRRRNLQADIVLYHSLLDACAKRAMPMLADQILRDMATDGHAANNMTLCILVKLFGRESWGRALRVFNELPTTHGFEPTAAAYTCLISAALQHGEIAGAINTKERMNRAGCTIDAKVYQTLLNGCLRNNDLDAAVGVAEEAVTNKVCTTKTLDDILFMSERRGRTDLAARTRFLRRQ